MKNANKIVGLVIAVLIVASGSFYGGMLYGKSKNSFGQRMGQFRENGQMGPGAPTRQMNGNQNRGLMNGEIISLDDKSLTIKLPDGGSKIIFFSGQTSIGKAISGSVSDLAVGQIISASGTANSDGSVAAQQIQIRPATSTSTPNGVPTTPPVEPAQ